MLVVCDLGKKSLQNQISMLKLSSKYDQKLNHLIRDIPDAHLIISKDYISKK